MISQADLDALKVGDEIEFEDPSNSFPGFPGFSGWASPEYLRGRITHITGQTCETVVRTGHMFKTVMVEKDKIRSVPAKPLDTRPPHEIDCVCDSLRLFREGCYCGNFLHMKKLKAEAEEKALLATMNMTERELYLRNKNKA